MHCVRKIKEDLYWVGANDRRLAMFEGVFSVPKGVSYNSYFLLDDKTVLFDTVDKAVGKVFFENLSYVLDGRPLDYVVVHHMEPDHSATLTELLERYPGAKIVCNRKIQNMIYQFFGIDVTERAIIVKEGDSLDTGNRKLAFYMAPMVHWPEVMVTYDPLNGTLFSADAFGTFGALNGAVFADEVDFDRDYLDECRRYYTNIVGKYGVQVQSLLKKAAASDIRMICPLHGMVWRDNIGYIVDKHEKWASYIPEETGVLITYASIYGNTENVAEIISAMLREKGVKTVMFDVSVTDSSEILSQCFKYSHLVFASATYNTGIFIKMDELLRDIAAHNLQNRTVGFIQNGSWAPAAGKLMKEILSPLKNLDFLNETLTVNSSLKENQLAEAQAFADAIVKSIKI
ncbi:MAG: FprA family A-type flavoprotein [Eubacteriales bacterium]|nr:FprA family A-type flavoprotein [Eubacteriales bacterium]